jgi:hypothetical protein
MLHDREGREISTSEWMGLVARGADYSQVAYTVLSDDVRVSTVWLGGSGIGDPPLIFETMIFGGPLNGAQWRYPNEVAALAGHDQAVAAARA